MDKLIAILVTLIGILLVLPLIGVTALDGIAAWINPLAVLVVGVDLLIKEFKK